MTTARSTQQCDQDINRFINTVIASEQLWLLTDEHGCMMLNSEDEDCVPVWSEQAFALAWINDDWCECKATAVGLSEWSQRWVPGLIDDDLAIVINPDQQAMGVVMLPDELAYEIGQRQKRR